MGKYLSDRVYLEAEQGLDNQSSKASVSVEVTPKITFESEIGANSEGGIGESEACRGKKEGFDLLRHLFYNKSSSDAGFVKS